MADERVYSEFHARVLDGLVEKDFDLGPTLGKGVAGKVVVGTTKRKNKGESGRSYAIKLFDTRSWTDADRKSFFRECLLLSKSYHPNVVELVAIYRNLPGKYGMAAVTELCTGGELFDRLQKSGTLSEEEARSVAFKTLSALEHMHRMGIAHRDVKPENLVYKSWDKDAELKLIDFGFAKCRHKVNGSGNSERGETDMFRTRLGSPNYVAPEVLSSGAKGYTEKCDIWSLGVTLYIMLCGYFPFYHRIEKIMYQQIVSGDYSLEDPEWQCISDEAKALVRRMLTVDPQRRPSAAECLRDPWVCQAGVARQGALPPSTFERFTEFNRARKSKFVQAVRAVIAARKLLEQQERHRQPFSVLCDTKEVKRLGRLSLADVALLLIARNKRRRPSRLLCLFPDAHVLPELTCLDYEEGKVPSPGKENQQTPLDSKTKKGMDCIPRIATDACIVSSGQKSFSKQLNEIMHGSVSIGNFSEIDGKDQDVSEGRASKQNKSRRGSRFRGLLNRVMGRTNVGGGRRRSGSEEREAQDVFL